MYSPKGDKMMFDLYVSQYCPYCKKVMSFLDEYNIGYNLKDVAQEENFEKLVSLGGKDQVPFLNDTDNDVLMYESDDIIAYIKNLQG
jgi:glutaredoxin